MENQTLKTFSIEEANSLIPKISEYIERARTLFQAIKSLTKDMEDLQYIWGREIADPSNMDHQYYMEKITSRERAVREMNATIEEVNGLGCIVKDAETGLVDFYYEHKGQLIMLCWRHGEKQIGHWHSIDGGASARRSLSEIA